MVSYISGRSGCDSASMAGGAADMPDIPMRVRFLRTAYVRVPSVGLIFWRAVMAFCLLQSFVDLGVYCPCGECLHLSFDHPLLRRSSCPSHLLDSCHVSIQTLIPLTCYSYTQTQTCVLSVSVGIQTDVDVLPSNSALQDPLLSGGPVTPARLRAWRHVQLQLQQQQA